MYIIVVVAVAAVLTLRWRSITFFFALCRGLSLSTSESCA